MKTKLTIPHDKIDDILDEADVEADVRENYSGRGMYGDTCFGLTVDRESEMFKFFVAAGHILDMEDAMTLASSAHSDNMGRSIIFYFPGVKLSDED